MRRIILAGVFAAAAVASIGPAEAQAPLKVNKPGYLIIRVLLDSTGAAADPNNPNGAAGPRQIDPSHSVAAVVPYTYIERLRFQPDKPPNQLSNPTWPAAFKHKDGILYAFTDKTFLQSFPVYNKSFDMELKDSYERWSVKRSYDAIHDICNKALMIGKVDEAFKYCDEYLKLPEVMGNAPQTSQYTAFAKAYKGLHEKLSTPLAPNEAAEEWKGRIGATGVAQGNYYTLLYFDTNQQKDAQRRMKVLDSNFRAFFLWHALQGVALPVPQKKLVAILGESSTQTTNFRDGLDGLPLISDAFYSPSHNILMLAPERMDPNGMQFMNMVRARYAAGWNREELIRKMPAIPPAPGKAQEAALHQTLAVADQYITEEADNAAISREGCRQLMAVTGLLPANVLLPEWLERGVGFYWQRAKGPLYLRNINNGKYAMSVGLATGYGTPNFEQHRAFDTVKMDFARKPEVTLQNVLLGNYYVGVRNRQDIDPKPAPPEGGGPNGAAPPPPPPVDPNEPPNAAERFKQIRLIFKADSSAWALVYYLEKTKLAGLQKFYQELAKMPRDIRLESETVMKIFCKTFGLSKVDGTPDVAAMKSFAESWLQYMNNVPHYDYEVPLDAATLDPFAAGAGSQPPAGNQPGGARPGQPGGAGGGAGGGGGGPGGGGRPGPPGGGGGGRPGGPVPSPGG